MNRFVSLISASAQTQKAISFQERQFQIFFQIRLYKVGNGDSEHNSNTPTREIASFV
jgi:hypothetical protein